MFGQLAADRVGVALLRIYARAVQQGICPECGQSLHRVGLKLRDGRRCNTACLDRGCGACFDVEGPIVTVFSRGLLA